jgi:hypothetical protein
MRSCLLLLVVHALACLPVLAQTSGQWRFSKRNANGTYTDYGLTAENDKAISFSGGVPAMLSLSTYAPLASPTFTGTVTIPSGASISGYLTSATAASTYVSLSGSYSNPSWITALANNKITGLGAAALLGATSGTFSAADAGKVLVYGTGGDIAATSGVFGEREERGHRQHHTATARGDHRQLH